MHYPIWQVPYLGGGGAIAVVAVLHVFIAHIAVGLGIVNAVLHTRAHRQGHDGLLDFLRSSSRFIILIPFIVGALTGVGIWFTISLASPVATSALIHNFVWFWATEWVFFAVEIAAGYIYYAGFGRLSPKRQLAVAWIYAVAAWLSLFLINGIITFMMTPGDWLTTRHIWDGFFNPTFWPSLLFRTFMAISFGALAVALITHASKRISKEARSGLLAFSSRWLILILFLLPLGFWYLSAVPENAYRIAAGGVARFATPLRWAAWLIAMTGATALAGALWKRLFGWRTVVALLTLSCLAIIGCFEFVREGIRKPFVIGGYLYANGIAVDEVARLKERGLLSGARWIVPPGVDLDRVPPAIRGRWVFLAQGIPCHTIGGINSLAKLTKGWDEATLSAVIDNLDSVNLAMPPFAGSEKDRDDLVAYLLSITKGE